MKATSAPATAAHQLTTFDFTPGMQLRSIRKEGELWFIAKDISKALGLRDATAAARILDDDSKGTISNTTLGGNQAMTIVSEAGLYALIMRSRKPAAKAFTKWVVGTVLPTLRKDGIYIAGQEKPLADDLTLPELLAQLQHIQAKIDTLKELKVREWAERSREEREGRTNGFRAMRGQPPIKIPSRR